MKFWKYIDAIGRVDCQGDFERLFRLRLLVLFSLICAIPTTPMIAYFHFSGMDAGVSLVISAVTVMLLWCTLPVLWMTRSISRASWFLLTTTPVGLMFYAFYTGGILSPHAVYLVIAPMLGGLLMGLRGTIICFLINVTLFLTLVIAGSLGLEPGRVLKPELLGISYVLSYSMTLLVLSAATVCFIIISNHSRRQLEIAKIAAESSDRAKSEFLATMSHEIRTPLNSILGMTQVLSGDDLDNDQRRKVSLISESGEALLSVITDILDVSKLDSGQVELENLTFHPGDVIQSACDIIRVRMEEKGLDCIVNIPDEMLEIVADPTRVRQVLINLIGNAVKFTDKGSITVSAETVSVEGSGQVIRFNIQDTGIGISELAQDKLFMAFTQADSSVSRQYGGTGLGLAICDRLVQMMGGEIGVDSHEGEGSRFWFTIKGGVPSKPSQWRQHSRLDLETLAVDDRVGIELKSRNLTVLGVDDNPANRLVLSYLTTPFVEQLDLAIDGEEALQKAAVAPYDVILMDLQMPGMGGLQAMQTIRSGDGPNSQTPVIAFTAKALTTDREKYLEAGFMAYVTKPIDLDVLQAALLEVTSPADELELETSLAI